ncbi:hypothetical protein K402DRAFT_391131 [Aulographum hederae CBS 113979]|uniref:Uncharacterized protein n=1 Tax=Aulographum hederae CBS 113979 TaxID=1176131 RepID=A0A6G1H7C3_9PEZI|nr:hypothetical protein K402DRAFT_391131 [Aulographum hederae CBS 113979]
MSDRGRREGMHLALPRGTRGRYGEPDYPDKPHEDNDGFIFLEPPAVPGLKFTLSFEESELLRRQSKNGSGGVQPAASGTSAQASFFASASSTQPIFAAKPSALFGFATNPSDPFKFAANSCAQNRFIPGAPASDETSVRMEAWSIRTDTPWPNVRPNILPCSQSTIRQNLRDDSQANKDMWSTFAGLTAAQQQSITEHCKDEKLFLVNVNHYPNLIVFVTRPPEPFEPIFRDAAALASKNGGWFGAAKNPEPLIILPGIAPASHDLFPKRPFIPYQSPQEPTYHRVQTLPVGFVLPDGYVLPEAVDLYTSRASATRDSSRHWQSDSVGKHPGDHPDPFGPSSASRGNATPSAQSQHVGPSGIPGSGISGLFPAPPPATSNFTDPTSLGGANRENPTTSPGQSLFGGANRENPTTSSGLSLFGGASLVNPTTSVQARPSLFSGNLFGGVASGSPAAGSQPAQGSSLFSGLQRSPAPSTQSPFFGLFGGPPAPPTQSTTSVPNLFSGLGRPPQEASGSEPAQRSGLFGGLQASSPATGGLTFEGLQSTPVQPTPSQGAIGEHTDGDTVTASQTLDGLPLVRHPLGLSTTPHDQKTLRGEDFSGEDLGADFGCVGADPIETLENSTKENTPTPILTPQSSPETLNPSNQLKFPNPADVSKFGEASSMSSSPIAVQMRQASSGSIKGGKFHLFNDQDGESFAKLGRKSSGPDFGRFGFSRDGAKEGKSDGEKAGETDEEKESSTVGEKDDKAKEKEKGGNDRGKDEEQSMSEAMANVKIDSDKDIKKKASQGCSPS